MQIRVFFHQFWPGFENGEDPVSFKFFKMLFEKVYETKDVTISNFENANVLVESPWIRNSLVNYKKWVNTYLFSGESYLNQNPKNYDCVMYGQETFENFVNIPLYIPYIVSSFDEKFIKENKSLNIQNVPEKDVVVFISNPGGNIRNKFLESLEKKMNVTYAGNYKNNIGFKFDAKYNTKEFQNFVSQFKFIITMENSEQDTYITEKITHGFFAGNIPIYWGSKKIRNYVNPERVMILKDVNDIENIIYQMCSMTKEEWLRKVNSRPFTEYGSQYGIDEISQEIKNCLKI